MEAAENQALRHEGSAMEMGAGKVRGCEEEEDKSRNVLLRLGIKK